VLEEADGLLRVRLVINSYGRPERGFRPEAIALKRGEWAQWQVNYRFADEDQWRYRFGTLSIAYGDANPGTPEPAR